MLTFCVAVQINYILKFDIVGDFAILSTFDTHRGETAIHWINQFLKGYMFAGGFRSDN